MRNIKYDHPQNFLSNLDRRDKRAILEASRRSKVKIYVEDKAYDGNGKPLKDLVAIFSNDSTQDHTDLWCEYNYLVYLARKNRLRGVVRV